MLLRSGLPGVEGCEGMLALLSSSLRVFVEFDRFCRGAHESSDGPRERTDVFDDGQRRPPLHVTSPRRYSRLFLLRLIVDVKEHLFFLWSLLPFFENIEGALRFTGIER